MIGRDEPHLFREREVKKEDTTMRAITRLIVDITIRTHVPPGMSAIYLFKLLIHRRPYENGNCTEFATKTHRRHKRNYLTGFLTVRFFFVAFVLFCGVSQRVVRGGRWSPGPLMKTMPVPP